MFANNDQYHTSQCSVYPVSEKQTVTKMYMKKIINFLSLPIIKFTGRFIIFSMITNVYNKKTKGPTLMELFTATGKLKKFFF